MAVEIEKLNLELVKEALDRVEEQYFVTPIINGHIMHSERIFAYEFYHQLRVVFDKGNENSTFEFGKGHQISGEFRKGFEINGEFRKERGAFNNRDNFRTMIPDLVIHHSDTTASNALAMEIKSSPRVTRLGIFHDLSKLEMLTRQGTDQFNFQLGIMLIINKEFDEIIFNHAGEISGRIRRIITDFPRIQIWNKMHGKPLRVIDRTNIE